MHDIFYFTDIHGVRPLFDAIMNYCHKQDEDAMIIFGGDAIDRGESGYAIMKELLENPKVVYLKGNHEDMFTKAAREIKILFNFKDRPREDVKKVLNACRNFDYKYGAIQDSLCNGGLPTLLDWIDDGMPMNIVDHIEHLPLTFSYENKDFCHAGSTYQIFNRVADAEYNVTDIGSWDADSLIWSRTTIDVGWEPNRVCVFGHTPTPYIEDYLPKFKWPKGAEFTPVLYKGTIKPDITGWKLDMDTGAVFTGRAYVLNVLTMKAQGFELKDNSVKKIEMIQF